MSRQILPFYLVCDESWSMAGESIDAINTSLPEIHAAVASNPVVADKAHFGLIGFSDTAEVLLPLSDLSDVTVIPALRAQGKTSYGAAFRVLRTTIDDDVRRLREDGNRMFRPAVFFLSDGLPTDHDWETEYAALVDPEFRGRPNILAFGFGQADREIIQKVATVNAFMANGELSPADALAEFARSLVRSMILSSRTTSTGDSPTTVPAQVPGYTILPAEEIT